MDLDQYIKGSMPSTDRRAEDKSLPYFWGITSDILKGLAFLHEYREAHLGLRPRNGMILINGDNTKFCIASEIKNGKSQILGLSPVAGLANRVHYWPVPDHHTKHPNSSDPKFMIIGQISGH